MGAGQLLVEDGWIGVTQLQIDNICIGVRQLRIYCIPLLLDHSILRTCASLHVSWGCLNTPDERCTSRAAGNGNPKKHLRLGQICMRLGQP